MPEQGSEILVVGSLNMDVIAFTPRFPAPGETLMGSRWTTANGGKGANQAVAAARLGGRVAMLGCVGRDAYGETLREALLRDGIDCGGVLIDSQSPTGVALITVSEQDSQNSIIVISGSNMRLTPDHIDAHRELMARATIVVCQLEVPMATVTRVIDMAAEMNKRVILNPAPPAVPDALPPSLLSKVGILIPNESEAAALCGFSVTSLPQAESAAKELRSRGCRDVIVTLGAGGVVHAGALGTRHYPAHAANAVDTTAAGDTFIGALCAALSRDAALDAAIEFGQSAAAKAVSRVGAQTSIPTWAELRGHA
jgi:ribokinase